jgi:hypothetical protein
LKRRSITLTEAEARGLAILAAKYDTTVQDILSKVIGVTLTSEAQQDPIVRLMFEQAAKHPGATLVLPAQVLN